MSLDRENSQWLLTKKGWDMGEWDSNKANIVLAVEYQEERTSIYSPLTFKIVRIIYQSADKTLVDSLKLNFGEHPEYFERAARQWEDIRIKKRRSVDYFPR